MADFRRAPGKPGVHGQRVSPARADGSRDAIEYC
jgi:hypothetical protein